MGHIKGPSHFYSLGFQPPRICIIEIVSLNFKTGAESGVS